MNYIANDILNKNDETLLCYKINEKELLEVIREIVSYYLFKDKQVLIITDSYEEYILANDSFKDLDKRLINLNNDFNLKALIKYLLLNLQDQTGKTIISKVELIYRSINKKYDSLKEISIFFNNCDNDIPLIDKYILTKRKLDSNNNYNKYYRTFRIKKPFQNYSYNELNEICNNILLSDISNQYIQHRRFIDNDISQYFKMPLDYSLINNSITSLKTIIDNKDIDYSLSVSTYTKDFIDEFISNKIVDEDYILSLTNTVNLKYNYKLLNNPINQKWFNIFHRFNRAKEKENLKIFSRIKNEIYEEYTNNYKSIKILKEKLSFLKLILKEDKYNEAIVSIIKNGNVYENLIFYKKILEVAYENRHAIDSISNLSSIEENILKYCYDDLEEKKYIKELISLLPLLKCYLDIEEEEFKNINIINLYKEYDSIINDIYEENSKKNTIISKAINKIWDNKLKDASSILKDNIDNISDDTLIRFFPCVISNFSNKKIEEFKSNKIYFDKVIVISKARDKLIDLNYLSNLSKSIILIDIDNNLKEIEFTKENNYLNKENNEILSEIKYFLLNKNMSIDIVIIDTYMELKINDYKIILLLNTTSLKKDVLLYKYYKDNNIYIYRLWYRDWWINKYKELDKINNYIKELTIINK
ncbi:hypothetical protein [Clostridium sp. HCS.1]|uniref:hypothetical protein n=1 Tax=Clostridium sp. HCS.1 TaxID=3238594 RepID=UPI003A0FC8CD